MERVEERCQDCGSEIEESCGIMSFSFVSDV